MKFTVFLEKYIKRELMKAYCGFKSENDQHQLPVATGAWGCGVFCGNKELKFIIQIIAASMTGRSIVYHSFNEQKFQSSAQQFVTNCLVPSGITTNKLLNMILEFNEHLDEYQMSCFHYLQSRMSDCL